MREDCRKLETIGILIRAILKSYICAKLVAGESVHHISLTSSYNQTRDSPFLEMNTEKHIWQQKWTQTNLNQGLNTNRDSIQKPKTHMLEMHSLLCNQPMMQITLSPKSITHQDLRGSHHSTFPQTAEG